MATQLIAQVAQAFDVNLSLRTVFNAPTIKLLSTEIEDLIMAKIVSMSEDETQQLLNAD